MNKFMYVGPTISGVAIHNTIYEDKPETLNKAIQFRPYLAGLCIPIEKLAVALAQMNRQQGGIYHLYQKAFAESADIQKGVI